MDIHDVRRNNAADEIRRAVQAAIRADMAAKDFRSEAADAWTEELREQAEQARKDLEAP